MLLIARLQITGFRATCSLRHAQHRTSGASSITDSQILAADRLRRDAHAVAIGLSNGRDRSAAQSWTYGPPARCPRPPIPRMATRTPVTGPSALAVRNIKVWPRYRAAMALFDQAQRNLLTWVVLVNKSVAGARHSVSRTCQRHPTAPSTS